MSKRRLLQEELSGKRRRRDYWRFGPPFPLPDERVEEPELEEEQPPRPPPLLRYPSPIAPQSPLHNPQPTPHAQEITLDSFARTAETLNFSDDDLEVNEATTSEANAVESSCHYGHQAPTSTLSLVPPGPPSSRRASIRHKDMRILPKPILYGMLPADAVVAQPPDGICPRVLFPPPNATNIRCPFCDVSWSRPNNQQQVRNTWASHVRRKHHLHVPDGFWRINELAAGLRRRQPRELQLNQMLNLFGIPSRHPIEERSHAPQSLNKEQILSSDQDVDLALHLPIPLSQSETPINSLDMLEQPSASFTPPSPASRQSPVVPLESNNPLALPDSPHQMEQDDTGPLETTTSRSLIPLSYESPDAEQNWPSQGSPSEVSNLPPPLSPSPNLVRSPGRATALSRDPPPSPLPAQPILYYPPCPLSPQPKPLPPSFPSFRPSEEAAPPITERQVPPSPLPLPPPEDQDSTRSTRAAYPTQPNDGQPGASTDDWVVVEEAPTEGNASLSGESREEFHLDFDSFEYSESDDSSFEEIASVRMGGRRFHADGLRSSRAALETQDRPRSGHSGRTDTHEDSPIPSNRAQGLEERSLNDHPASSSPNFRRAYEEQLDELRALVQQATLLARRTEALERMQRWLD